MLFKSYTDRRITSPLSADVFAAWNLTKTPFAVLRIAGNKNVYYVFGRRVKG